MGAKKGLIPPFPKVLISFKLGPLHKPYIIVIAPVSSSALFSPFSQCCFPCLADPVELGTLFGVATYWNHTSAIEKWDLCGS